MRNDSRTPLGRGCEHAGVADGMLARRGHGGGEAGQKGQGVEVDGVRAVVEGPLELDADEVVGE